MNGDPFKTPLNKARLDAQSRPTTSAKRDSLAAELERGMNNIHCIPTCEGKNNYLLL